MVLDLFRNNREYYDLTWYGIEGKHYTAIGDTGYSSLPDSPITERAAPAVGLGCKFYAAHGGRRAGAAHRNYGSLD